MCECAAWTPGPAPPHPRTRSTPLTDAPTVRKQSNPAHLSLLSHRHNTTQQDQTTNHHLLHRRQQEHQYNSNDNSVSLTRQSNIEQSRFDNDGYMHARPTSSPSDPPTSAADSQHDNILIFPQDQRGDGLTTKVCLCLGRLPWLGLCYPRRRRR